MVVQHRQAMETTIIVAVIVTTITTVALEEASVEIGILLPAVWAITVLSQVHSHRTWLR